MGAGESFLFAWEQGAGAHFKIVSYLCPVACNCQFSTSTALVNACPASCSCPCPVNEPEPKSCALPLTFIAAAPEARLEAVGAQCCKLLGQLAEAYAAQKQQQLETVVSCLCKSCYRRCIDAFWVAPVSNLSASVGHILADRPNQTARQRLSC